MCILTTVVIEMSFVRSGIKATVTTTLPLHDERYFSSFNARLHVNISGDILRAILNFWQCHVMISFDGLVALQLLK